MQILTRESLSAISPIFELMTCVYSFQNHFFGRLKLVVSTYHKMNLFPHLSSLFGWEPFDLRRQVAGKLFYPVYYPLDWEVADQSHSFRPLVAAHLMRIGPEVRIQRAIHYPSPLNLSTMEQKRMIKQMKTMKTMQMRVLF